MAVTRNRNALRSQRLIREAFVKLVEQGQAETMTVADICRTADINRSTFYAHYDNVDDLKEHLVKAIGEEMIDVLKESVQHLDDADLEPMMIKIGRIHAQNLPLYNALVEALPEANGMSTRDVLLELMPELTPEQLVEFDFVLSAVLSTLHTWTLGVYGDMPIDDLSRTFARYISAIRTA